MNPTTLKALVRSWTAPKLFIGLTAISLLTALGWYLNQFSQSIYLVRQMTCLAFWLVGLASYLIERRDYSTPKRLTRLLVVLLLGLSVPIGFSLGWGLTTAISTKLIIILAAAVGTLIGRLHKAPSWEWLIILLYSLGIVSQLGLENVLYYLINPASGVLSVPLVLAPVVLSLLIIEHLPPRRVQYLREVAVKPDYIASAPALVALAWLVRSPQVRNLFAAVLASNALILITGLYGKEHTWVSLVVVSLITIYLGRLSAEQASRQIAVSQYLPITEHSMVQGYLLACLCLALTTSLVTLNPWSIFTTALCLLITTTSFSCHWLIGNRTRLEISRPVK